MDFHFSVPSIMATMTDLVLVISFKERGMPHAKKKTANMLCWETSTCVSNVCLMRLVVTGCLWISEHTIIVLGSLTSSPYIPHGFSVWYLLKTENYVYSTSVLLSSLTIAVKQTCLESHDSNTVLLLDSWESELKYRNGLVISFIASEFAL